MIKGFPVMGGSRDTVPGSQMDALARLVGSAGVAIRPVEFTTPRDSVPGLKSEYRLDGDRVQYHFFAEEGHKFPKDFMAKVRKALHSIPPGNLIVEYVSEVKSWYVEVRGIAMPSKNVAELLAKRMQGVLSE